MKGFTEIFLSCTLGLSAIFAYTFMKKEKPLKEHRQEPTVMSGESEDPALSLNWGLEEVHAPAAWKHQKGSRNVIVAVIDTGCDIHHPDLKDNIWRNPGEGGLDRNGDPKSSNGIDDDGNGFVDDFHGWNFSGNNNDKQYGNNDFVFIVRSCFGKIFFCYCKFHVQKFWRNKYDLQDTSYCKY